MNLQRERLRALEEKSVFTARVAVRVCGVVVECFCRTDGIFIYLVITNHPYLLLGSVCKGEVFVYMHRLVSGGEDGYSGLSICGTRKAFICVDYEGL